MKLIEWLRSKYFQPPTGKTYTRANLDRLMGRAFASALLLSGAETTYNALQERVYLNQFWFWVFLISMLVGQVTVFVTMWFLENSKHALRAYGVFCIVLILGWWLQVVDPAVFPDNFQPWVWWTVGIGLIGVTLGFGIWVGGATTVLLSGLWLFLRQTPMGGSEGFEFALQESVYTFTLAVCFSVLITLMRYQAQEADKANQLAAEAAAERARVDAIEGERQRVAALVHDRVLTTLLLAAKSKTKDEQAAAADLAKLAINQLTAAGDPNHQALAQISISSFFDALKSAIELEAPAVHFEIRDSSNQELPPEVAEAALEATLQAVANSVQHAGRGQIHREVRMRETSKGFKIVVKDDGIGFRPSRIGRDRLGVRLSIIGRMEAVGGKVAIDSVMGAGTNIVIEWSHP